MQGQDLRVARSPIHKGRQHSKTQRAGSKTAACRIGQAQQHPTPLNPHIMHCRRFYLEIEGKQRFKVLESWEQDGYRVARPEFFQDMPPSQDTPEHTALQAISQSVDDLASIWLDKVRYVSKAHWV